MRPCDYEVSNMQGDVDLYDFAEADESCDPLMQLLAAEAEDAGVDVVTYLYS